MRGTRKILVVELIDEDTKSKLEEMRVRMFRKINYGNDTPESIYLSISYNCTRYRERSIMHRIYFEDFDTATTMQRY